MEEARTAAFRQQLESLYSISIEISRLHEMPQVLDRALSFCLELTLSEFGFIGLLNGNEQMDVAAIKGFEPSDPSFYENFRLIPVRPSVFGVVITNQRSKISNDVLHDPDRVDGGVHGPHSPPRAGQGGTHCTGDPDAVKKVKPVSVRGHKLSLARDMPRATRADAAAFARGTGLALTGSGR